MKAAGELTQLVERKRGELHSRRAPRIARAAAGSDSSFASASRNDIESETSVGLDTRERYFIDAARATITIGRTAHSVP